MKQFLTKKVLGILVSVYILIKLRILIIHDETLVVLCFILFIYLISINISEIITTTLTRRARLVSDEWRAYTLSNLTILEHLRDVYELRSEVADDLEKLYKHSDLLIKEFEDTIPVKYENKLVSALNAKLSWVSQKEVALVQELQTKLKDFYSKKVLELWLTDSSNLGKKFFNPALKTLKVTIQKKPLKSASWVIIKPIL
jgi:hypothetical protein